jgi:hypothetical protein
MRMDDFDRRLEIELANLLDPIVDAPAPRRRRQSTLRAIAGGLDGQPIVELTVVVPEPIPVVATPVGTTV